MEPIDWKQNGNKISLIFKVSEQNQNILLDSKILPLIVAHTPKVFFVKIKYNGQIYDFIVDFTGIKPVINRRNSLKISTKKSAQAQQNIQPQDNFYVIMRGESFQQRFLSRNGWTAQEYAFPIQFIENQEVTKQETTVKTKFEQYENKGNAQSTQQVKATIKTKAKSTLQECPVCNAVIIDNVDYCPNCFTPLFTPEQGVDFAL